MSERCRPTLLPFGSDGLCNGSTGSLKIEAHDFVAMEFWYPTVEVWCESAEPKG